MPIYPDPISALVQGLTGGFQLGTQLRERRRGEQMEMARIAEEQRRYNEQTAREQQRYNEEMALRRQQMFAPPSPERTSFIQERKLPVETDVSRLDLADFIAQENQRRALQVYASGMFSPQAMNLVGLPPEAQQRVQELQERGLRFRGLERAEKTENEKAAEATAVRQYVEGPDFVKFMTLARDPIGNRVAMEELIQRAPATLRPELFKYFLTAAQEAEMRMNLAKTSEATRLYEGMQGFRTGLEQRTQPTRVPALTIPNPAVAAPPPARPPLIQPPPQPGANIELAPPTSIPPPQITEQDIARLGLQYGVPKELVEQAIAAYVPDPEIDVPGLGRIKVSQLREVAPIFPFLRDWMEQGRNAQEIFELLGIPVPTGTGTTMITPPGSAIGGPQVTGQPSRIPPGPGPEPPGWGRATGPLPEVSGQSITPSPKTGLPPAPLPPFLRRTEPTTDFVTFIRNTPSLMAMAKAGRPLKEVVSLGIRMMESTGRKLTQEEDRQFRRAVTLNRLGISERQLGISEAHLGLARERGARQKAKDLVGAGALPVRGNEAQTGADVAIQFQREGRPYQQMLDHLFKTANEGRRGNVTQSDRLKLVIDALQSSHTAFPAPVARVVNNAPQYGLTRTIASKQARIFFAEGWNSGEKNAYEVDAGKKLNDYVIRNLQDFYRKKQVKPKSTKDTDDIIKKRRAELRAKQAERRER